MRICVAHETLYRYETPCSGVIQTLRLTPRNHTGQYVVDWRLEISADCRLEAQEDAFGNVTHAFSANGPISELRVMVEGEVETQDTAGLVRGAADKIDEFASSTRDKTVEELFETASDFARRQPAVVFGAAAAAGFLLFRILKVAPSSGASQGASVRGPDGRFRDQPGNQEFGRTGMTNGQAASRRPGQTMGQRHGV